MKTIISLAIVGASVGAHAISATLTPNSLWGTGGYLAAGVNPSIANDNNSRGMAYNSTTGNVLVASRTGGTSVRILNSAGAEVGTLGGVTAAGGVTGGTFAINKIGIGDDGRIYLANLTTNATSSPFKIYRWDNEADTTAEVIYSGTPLAGARVGDSMDVIGSGSNTRLVFGYGSAPAVAGNNGYSVFTENGGGTLDANHFDFSGITPGAGDHRLGLTFLDQDTVLGGQNSSVRLSDFSIGGTATFLGSPVISASINNQRMYDYRVVNGIPILVTMDSGVLGATRDGSNVPTGNLLVRVFDFSSPLTPTLLASDVIPAAGVANTNGTGDIRIAYSGGSTATIYALATNNGIQSFNLEVVPEPATLLALGLGASALLRRRTRRS